MFGFGKNKGEGKFPEESFPALPDEPLPNTPENLSKDLPDLPSMGDSILPPLDSQTPNSKPMDFPSQPQSFPRENFQDRHSISPIEPTRTHEEIKKPEFDKNELVLAKLDNIKSMLDVVNQRLSTLESKMDNKRW